MPAAARGKKDTHEHFTGEPTELSDFLFEVLRYDVTGISNYEGIENYCGVSRYPAEILLHILWKKYDSSVYLLENAVPSYTGKIDSTFCKDDFSTVTDYTWINTAIESSEEEKAGEKIEELEMQPPEELSKAAEESAAGKGTEGDASIQNESPSERRYRDAEGRLRLFSYGIEFFSVSGSSANRVLVSSQGTKMTRKVYDDMMRLVKKESWTVGQTSADAVKIRTEFFYYNDAEQKPFSAVAETKDTRTEFLYNEKGSVYSRTEYSIGDDANRRLETRTLWKYNGDNKITEEEFTKFEYDGVRQTGKSVRKEIYDYRISGCPPDYYYYEDDQLRMQTMYADNDEYTTTLYFDNNFTVTTVYKHGRRAKETFMKGNKIERSRNYEN
jgi:hypothetical protein